jgi:hypothetical protein
MKYRHYFRRPRTLQERRAWFASLEQGYKPRARRSPNRLPNDWDDIQVHWTSYENRQAGEQWRLNHTNEYAMYLFRFM